MGAPESSRPLAHSTRVGCGVGLSVGGEVGTGHGTAVGAGLGTSDGRGVGCGTGSAVGEGVGTRDGAGVGRPLGKLVGAAVGGIVGIAVGWLDGIGLGMGVVGVTVGAGVGAMVRVTPPEVGVTPSNADEPRSAASERMLETSEPSLMTVPRDAARSAASSSPDVTVLDLI